MEGRIDAHRDSKVMIYIQFITGMIMLNVFIINVQHLAQHHRVTPTDYITMLLSLIVGLFLLYKAYQQFQEKYHNFALAIAKKM